MKKIFFVFLSVLFTAQMHAQFYVNEKPFSEVATGQYIRLSVYSNIKQIAFSVDYGQHSRTIGIGDRIENKNGKPYKLNSKIDGLNQFYELGWEIIPLQEKDVDYFLLKRRKDFEFN